MKENGNLDKNGGKNDTLKENWKYWEEEMGEVYLENSSSHICSATDCTGLIPVGHPEEKVYERYEDLYPYQPNEELADDSFS